MAKPEIGNTMEPTTQEMTTPVRMEFLFVPYVCERRELIAAYNCIEDNKLWGWYRDPANPPTGSFVTSLDPNVMIVSNAIYKTGCDSSSAIALILRSMQAIAVNGLAHFEEQYTKGQASNTCKVCGCRATWARFNDRIFDDTPRCSCPPPKAYLNENGLIRMVETG